MRLIDADELINQGYEIVVDGWQYDTCNKSIDIDTIPTAYDVDKVVKELETNKQNALEVEESIKEYNVWNEAIEIVKQGGVSDDVCEWKKYPFDWFTGCDGYRIYNKQGDYCPRCGKKIKIVGD